ncbi:dipeptide/oligopeptide/nickel ABC transporter ATP-binding protein [bacterium]|nr:dipeptide/oligopeptide/nickel ABC transporter ATP-binding protein [bacterium]|tara:strand:- start:2645 stop:3712 length:1068 start_codon:yes stop_codon:yes gene_type:complete
MSPTTETQPPILKVENYKIGFRTERGLAKAVNGVSFSLERGETLAIVGESGSGKTVLNRGLMGLLTDGNTIEDGSAKFIGEEIVGLSRQNFWGTSMAMIFQDPMSSLNPVMKVGKQVAEPLQLHQGLTKKEAKKEVVELFKLVGIPDPEKRFSEYPHQLSGGMRQRVMISIALAIKPDLLIADEPTTALDVTVQKYILDLLRELQDQREMSVVLITHDLGVARGRADEILVMYGGKVMEHAPAEKIFTEMSHPYTEALTAAIPRLKDPKHTRLIPIPGSPPDLIHPPEGCKFAPRCIYAQEKCITDEPEVTAKGRHSFSCFYPVGTQENKDAYQKNAEKGFTAAGLKISQRRVLK